MVEKISSTPHPDDKNKLQTAPKQVSHNKSFAVPPGFIKACKTMFPGAPPAEVEKAAKSLLQSMLQSLSNTIKQSQKAAKAMKKISGDDDSD